MAESSLAVTPGSGQNLRTNTRTIGGGTVHEQGIIIGEGNAATYTAIAKNISITTTAAHVLFLQGDGTNYCRIRRITIQAVTPPASTTLAHFGVYRTTTAGSGGTTVNCRPFDTADTNPYAGVVQTLPTSKGTVSDQLLVMRVAYLGTGGIHNNTNRVEWIARDDNSKSIVFGSAITGGIAIQIETGVTSATVDVEVEFVVTSYL